MPTGRSSYLYYPKQDTPRELLKFDDSYFLVRLHDAQAFFSPDRPLQHTEALLVSSSVEHSFLKDKPTKSLYRFTGLKKNTPHLLGIHPNLTEWLPSIESDSLHIKLECKVLHGTPMKSLVDKTNDLQLVAVASLVQPAIATAITVGQVVGELLSFFAKEGSETSIFLLEMDLNLSGLEVGYHAVLGSQTNEPYPNLLEMKNAQLSLLGGRELSRYSYAVIEVRTLPRLRVEHALRQTWGELLYECRDNVLNMSIKDQDDRIEASERWRISLEHVNFLARKDRSVLSREVKALVGEAELAVRQKLNPSTTQESYTEEVYPEAWQQVLGFTTPQELRQAVRDYQDAVELSQRLLQEYQQHAD